MEGLEAMEGLAENVRRNYSLTFEADSRQLIDFARDRELVEQFQETGKQEAFERLYGCYRTRLYRWCLARTGNPEDAEDITEEAFFKAYKSLDRLQGERLFYPWIKRIAANLITDRYRVSQRAIVVENLDSQSIDLRADADPEPVDNLIRDEERERVQTALRRLNHRHRKVIELREREELSYRDIAERESLTLTAVETLLFRARQAFKREYLELAGSEENALPAATSIRIMIRNSRPKWRNLIRLRFHQGLIASNQVVLASQPVSQPSRKVLIGACAIGAASVVSAIGPKSPVSQKPITNPTRQQSVKTVSSLPLPDLTMGSREAQQFDAGMKAIAYSSALMRERAEQAMRTMKAHFPFPFTPTETTSYFPNGAAMQGSKFNAATNNTNRSTIDPSTSTTGGPSPSSIGTAVGGTVSSVGSVVSGVGGTVSGLGSTVSSLGNTVSGVGSQLGSTLNSLL
jgi:RNA polymerase sigma-70 factor (ECF subfamily)